MLPRSRSPSLPFRGQVDRRLASAPAEPLVHQWGRLPERRNIVTALPRLITWQPPIADAGLARNIVRIDHAPMLEGPLVVAPSALAITGRSKIATGLAGTRNVEPKPSSLACLLIECQIPALEIGLAQRLPLHRFRPGGRLVQLVVP